MLIDAHTHLQFKAFDEDREEVIKRTLEGGVRCINVGTQKDTSRSAVELAEKYEGFWAAVGLHPIHTSESYHDPKELGLPSEALAKEGGDKGFTSRGEEFDINFYEDLAKNPTVIAIGECGLDYFRAKPESRNRQEEIFRKQIELAIKLNKPLMIHCRNAYNELLSILKGYSNVKGNVHFFAGDWDTAKKFLDLGFSLSFTGVITFADQYNEVIKKVPSESILIETDAPYVTPVPYRATRNEPLYVAEVAKRIAQLRGISFEEISKLTTQNAKRVFGLEF